MMHRNPMNSQPTIRDNRPQFNQGVYNQQRPMQGFYGQVNNPMQNQGNQGYQGNQNQGYHSNPNQGNQGNQGNDHWGNLNFQ